MCVCVCLCMSVCQSASEKERECVCVCVCVCKSMHACVCMRAYMHAHWHACVCMHGCMHSFFLTAIPAYIKVAQEATFQRCICRPHHTGCRQLMNATHPLAVLREPLVGLLAVESLEVLLPVSQHCVHMGLVLHCQLQGSEINTTINK